LTLLNFYAILSFMEQKFIDICNNINSGILENPDVDLIEDGIIDSLDIMNLVAKCQQAFDIQIHPDDVAFENFSSASALWSLICRCKEEA